RWHGNAQRAGGLEVDHQLEFGRLQDGKVRRLLALENSPGIEAKLAPPVHVTAAVAHQAAGDWERAKLVARGNSVACREHGDLSGVGDEQPIGRNQQCTRFDLHERRKGLVKLVGSTGAQDVNLKAEFAGRVLSIPRADVRVRTFRVDERSEDLDLRNELP